MKSALSTVLAASFAVCTPAAFAQEIITTETVRPAPEVVVTETVRPAPVIIEERTTTTETRRLTDREKDALRERREFERKKAEAEREYLEKVREARKDYREEVRDDIDDD